MTARPDEAESVVDFSQGDDDTGESALPDDQVPALAATRNTRTRPSATQLERSFEYPLRYSPETQPRGSKPRGPGTKP